MVIGFFLEPGIFMKSVYFEITDSQSQEFPTNYLYMHKQTHSFLSLFSTFLDKLKCQISELVNIKVCVHIGVGTKIPRTKSYEVVS